MIMLSKRKRNDMPVALESFESIKRYWDAKNSVFVAKILPGEYYVTRHNEAILTVLGSCVSACISDRVNGIGGMNHFMLPQDNNASGVSLGHWHANDTSSSTRYGNFAMEHLINEILKHGGKKENLEIKVFGGGQIMREATDVGRRNIAFINDYINTEGLRLIAEDVADIFPRKVMYYPVSGRARVKKLKSLHTEKVVEREKSYMSNIAVEPAAGNIDLF